MPVIHTKASRAVQNSSRVKSRKIIEHLTAMDHSQIEAYVDNKFAQPGGAKELVVNLIKAVKYLLRE